MRYLKLMTASCAVLLFVLGHHCHAQCFANVTKNCSAQQFVNPCAGVCNQNTLNQPCGFMAAGDPALQFASHYSTPAGMFGYLVLVPQARYCGVVKQCVCTPSNSGLPPACMMTSNVVDQFTVPESYGAGLCDPEGEF